MSDAAAELQDLWAALESYPGTSGKWRAKRLAAESAVACFAALRNSDNNAAVLFEAPIVSAPRARLKFEAEGLTAMEHRDFHDGRYRVAVALEQHGFSGVFRAIAADLVNVVMSVSGTSDHWGILARRLEAWQTCLQTRRRSLGRQEQIGLFGELVALRYLAKGIGLARSVAAWTGPLHGLHDFLLPDRALEVKTATGEDSRIWVGSLYQLEPQDLPLAILRPRLRASQEGQSLSELVVELRRSIEELAPAEGRRFEELLMRAGYLAVDAADYTERFGLISILSYLVTDAFPRIRKASLDPAVVQAEYQLDENMLSPFRLQDGYLLQLLIAGSNHG